MSYVNLTYSNITILIVSKTFLCHFTLAHSSPCVSSIYKLDVLQAKFKVGVKLHQLNYCQKHRMHVVRDLKTNNKKIQS